MQITRILLYGLGCAVAIGLSAVPLAAQTTRSVQLLPPLETIETSGFDRSQSAALFVGVRHFTHDQTLAEVRYAVDDAIDLAFVFALDRNVRLVDAGRVILALSGEPQKTESQQKLDALRAAGATVRGAGETDVLALLERQARSVGRKGILIVSIATHGFNADGVHYVLAANSLFEHRETSISTGRSSSSTRAARRSGRTTPQRHIRTAQPSAAGWRSAPSSQAICSATASARWSAYRSTRRAGIRRGCASSTAPASWARRIGIPATCKR
jgi:hypothetical protein